jgi:hypothetical protein
MKQFEYKTINLPTKGWMSKIDTETLTQELNTLGKQGWEVITVNHPFQSNPKQSFILLKKEKL